MPLREARLSSFLSSSGAAAGEALPRDAFLSGTITDAQARLNLRNLVDGGRVSGEDLRRLARLFEFLGLPQRELQALAENLRFALDASPDNRSAAQAPLAPQRVAHAEWLGLSPATRRALEPFVTWLPQRTPVNLNTAPAEVVMAALPGLDMAAAQRLVAARAGRPFATLADAAQAAIRETGEQLGRLNARANDAVRGGAAAGAALAGIGQRSQIAAGQVG
ncbi:MAG: general secretion pathway protein GspK, partial [Burkholderiaceae bacterium]|nr:general secretion pathway protein GspK [Burkholderiaceae bacterium]